MSATTPVTASARRGRVVTEAGRAGAAHGADGGRSVTAPTQLVTARERAHAVAHWLLCAAAEDVEAAQQRWREGGAALLACGGLFAAIRLPGYLLRAAAGTRDPGEMDACVRGALEGGPVIADPYADHYYALTPASTAWSLRDRGPRGLAVLGRGCYLGVPSPFPDAPQMRAYWAVPMESAGELCDPRLVRKLAQRGVSCLAAVGGAAR
ncbi:hypothetical protein [Streptomyces thermodiastaticus]|uniref:hypothetical protein n=1 Tax=Streptomyces thermodiastaticus TaxID=44061 RepID=UPI00167BB93A|nr:hypothetical protein [Streptomyces thermodiastaticus]MCE7551104.1 hypothetical protein [Streptomyces thermodiastaticus]